MTQSDWKARLEAAIKETGRSKRSISMSMGRGEGYIHSILKEGKMPRTDNLIAICDEIGASMPFILYGIDIEPEDAEVIAAMREDPETREAVLSLLRRRQPSERP